MWVVTVLGGGQQWTPLCPLNLALTPDNLENVYKPYCHFLIFLSGWWHQLWNLCYQQSRYYDIALSSHLSRGVIVKHACNSCCRFSIALVRCCGYPIISSWALCSYYLRMVTIRGQHLDSARRANSSNSFWKPVDNWSVAEIPFEVAFFITQNSLVDFS